MEVVIIGYFINLFLFGLVLIGLTGVRNEHRSLKIREEKIIRLLMKSRVRRRGL